MTIYHALKCRGVYETFDYDLFGTLRFMNFRKKIKFLKLCRLTEKSCDRLCRKLNKNMEDKQ